MEEVKLDLSPSSIKTWRRCKRQYYYKYVEGIETRRPDLPLKRGSWVHQNLQYHYQDRGWRAGHNLQVKKFERLLLEEREYYGDLPGEAERLTLAYLHHYREDNWEVLFVEETFNVPHPNGSDFSFKPDLIVRDLDTGQVICWDHKTTKTIPDAMFRMQDLQSGFYPWGLRLAGIEVDVFGYNYIRTKVPTIPSINKDGSISKKRIDTDFYTLAKFLKEYYADEWPDIPDNWKIRLRTLKQTSPYFKRSKLDKPQAMTDRMVVELDYTTQEMQAWYEFSDEDEDPWVRTFIKSCEWDCEFHEVCAIQLFGGDGKYLIKTKFKPSTYLEGRKIGRQ